MGAPRTTILNDSHWSSQGPKYARRKRIAEFFGISTDDLPDKNEEVVGQIVDLLLSGKHTVYTIKSTEGNRCELVSR